MRCSFALAVGVVFLFLPPALRTQNAKSEKSKLVLTQRYLLLALGEPSTMQEELDEAAAGGYRSGGGWRGVRLERTGDPRESRTIE